MHSSRRSLALVRLRRSLPPSVCSLYSSIVLLVGSLFHHADFTFLHQGNSHLFAPLCHFLHAVVLSLFLPCCVLLSFGVLISRLSSEFWSLFALIWVRDGMLFSSLQHKFVIFFSQFVITFYHHRVFSFFLFTVQINSTNFKWISGIFFPSSLPISVSEGTWIKMFLD